jgi:hypothetical protein
MAGTREASRHNITALFKKVVATYQGAVKIETNFLRWEEQLYEPTVPPRLYFYYLGNPEPQVIQFSRALFDDCANADNTEDLARAEDLIRQKFDFLLKRDHP